MSPCTRAPIATLRLHPCKKLVNEIVMELYTKHKACGTEKWKSTTYPVFERMRSAKTLAELDIIDTEAQELVTRYEDALADFKLAHDKVRAQVDDIVRLLHAAGEQQTSRATILAQLRMLMGWYDKLFRTTKGIPGFLKFYKGDVERRWHQYDDKYQLSQKKQISMLQYRKDALLYFALLRLDNPKHWIPEWATYRESV